MSEIRFTKLHGNGNDFILIDEFREKVIPDQEKAAFALRFCDRHLGIGADGVLFLGRSGSADISMEIFNADGSRAEMCGNGIRCLAKYAFDAGYVGAGSCTVETDAGILGVEITPGNGVWVKVNMGRPLFARKDIPALGSGEFLDVELHSHRVSAVNTGVPHAVIFVDELTPELMEMAPRFRHDRIFPKGANVNFIKVDSRSEITVRTFERGVEGETLSCGTGAVAGAAVAHRLGKTGERIVVNTQGGLLNITLSRGEAFMEGTAETVFSGMIPEFP